MIPNSKKSEIIPYGELGWERQYEHKVVRDMLRKDLAFYKPHGPSLLTEAEQAIIALSGFTLNWYPTQDSNTAFQHQDLEFWIKPFLIWVTTAPCPFNEMHHYTIQRADGDHGPYVSKYKFTLYGGWREVLEQKESLINNVTNTLEEAKWICEKHYLEIKAAREK